MTEAVRRSACNQQGLTAVGSNPAPDRSSSLVGERFHLAGRPGSGP